MKWRVNHENLKILMNCIKIQISLKSQRRNTGMMFLQFDNK